MHDRWMELGSQLNDLNAEKYRLMLMVMEEMVAAEKSLARTDLDDLVVLLRAPGFA
jgi:hypothetical protein